MKQIFIAEIKTKSPFGFVSQYPFVSLMEQAIQHGDWVSVHTNALWGGDMDALAFVRRNTNKPILAKGLHTTDDDIERAIDHGADYVLVVDRFPSHKYVKNVLIETNDARVFNDRILKNHKLSSPVSVYHPWKYVCNSRDLRTGLPKKRWELDFFTSAGVWVCQASGIREMTDVDESANAFIVGEHLVEFSHEYARLKRD